MGFSEDDSMVRVDFFNAPGIGGMKWKYTEAVSWITYRAPRDQHGMPQADGKLVDQAFEEALTQHLTRPDGTKRMVGMMAVCLEPYHEHSFPLAILVKP